MYYSIWTPYHLTRGLCTVHSFVFDIMPDTPSEIAVDESYADYLLSTYET